MKFSYFKRSLNLRFTIPIAGLALLAGCTSFWVRQTCKEVNWYQHGFNIAMKGKWIESDTQVEACKKAEFEVPLGTLESGFKAGREKYCSPTEAFNQAKLGRLFSFEMCDGVSRKVMEARYNEGLLEFCTPQSGLNFGSTGEVYLKNCPAKLEEKFLPEYKKGRKNFLQASIQVKEKEVHDRESDLRRLDRDKSFLNARLLASPLGDPKVKDDPRTTERQNLESQISSLQSKINDENSSIRSLRDEVAKLKIELGTMN